METMKIENVDEALCLFEEAAIKQEEAIRSGKSKIANRNYDKMRSVVIFLKSNKSLGRLAVYYVHPNLSVRAWAASYLLPLYEKESIRVLKEIVNMKTFGSLDAEMTIKEWKNGNLRNFYTLQLFTCSAGYQYPTVSSNDLAERHHGVTPYSYCDNDSIGKIDPTRKDWIKDRYGSYLQDDEATGQETTRNGWNYIGTALPEGIDPYRILEERNGTLYHKNTSNPLASLVNLIVGKEVMVEKKTYDPAEDHMMQQFAETGSEFVIGEAAGKVVGKFVISTIVRRIPQIGNKLDYVFGQATGSVHNIERSTTMLRQLESIGVFDNKIGKNYLKEHLKDTFKVTKEIVQPNGRVLREPLLMGPNGGVKVESIWEKNKLISIIIIGGK